MHKVPWNQASGTERVREPGGMDDLQTDVMRFMAILGFCLVAIFALVQSIPMGPEPSAPPHDASARRLTPTPAPTPSLKPVEPRSLPPQRPPAKRPTAQTAAPAPRVTEPTFTLRFASDAALHRLVKSGQVQLYAMGKESVRRLSPGAGGLDFEPAAAPGRIHVMSENTVPSSLVAALSRAAGPATGEVTWGVTLPDSTSSAITRHLQSPTGGALVIQANGDVRREKPGEQKTGGGP